MIDSPYLNEIIREQVEKRTSLRVAEELPKKLAEELPKRLHRVIAIALKDRFGALPAEMTAALEKVTGETDLDRLIVWAGTCPSLESFWQKLAK